MSTRSDKGLDTTLWIAADPIDHTMINMLCRLTRHDDGIAS